MYKKYITKKYIIWAVITLLVAGGSYFIFRDKPINYEYSIVERTNLTQEVNVTGKVRPASKVDLAFESTGKVSGVYVEVGDKVYAGQRLANLNSAQYQAQYSQAVASLDAEKSRLEELKSGTRPEEIAVQESKVRNVEESLVDSQSNLINYLKDSYTKSDDAVRSRVDQFIINSRTSNPQLTFNSSYKLQIETERVFIESALQDWSSSIFDAVISINELDNQYDLARNNLSRISSFLDIVASAVNGLTVNSSLTQATIDAYKADINTARTNINTAIVNLTSAREKMRNAESTLMIAQQELTLKLSGATPEQIITQEAKVKSAEANVNNYGALIGKTIIYSPINGIVTKKEINVGEIIQTNMPAISVISTSQYEIETNIPESDISKVSIGDKARVTLDAYEDDTLFDSTVTMVDPAETVIEGVSAYLTTLQFDKKDERIRSGMTANIDIMTDMRENVLSVSYRSLMTEGGTFVEVLNDNNELEKRAVETGMRSSDGRIEIISGLKEGEKVVTSK